MRRTRSLLFAPANRPELIRKFLRYKADMFAIDLEDGTPEGEKAPARQQLAAIVAQLRDNSLKGRLLVRTNGSRSAHFEEDLTAALSAEIDGILLPKFQPAWDLRRIDTDLARAEQRTGRELALIGLIETAAALVNAEALAAAAIPHLTAIAFGAEDFITDIGGRRTAQGQEVLYARSRVVLAAKAAGIAALDQVFVGIRDHEGFRRDAELGRQLGYDGKMCIVPQQVEIANEIFSPSPEEIARSRRLIETYEAAKAAGRGAIDFEGQMIDEPTLKRARRIVEHAGASH